MTGSMINLLRHKPGPEVAIVHSKYLIKSKSQNVI